MGNNIFDKENLKIFSSEMLKTIKEQVKEKMERIVKDIDSILKERGEE